MYEIYIHSLPTYANIFAAVDATREEFDSFLTTVILMTPETIADTHEKLIADGMATHQFGVVVDIPPGGTATVTRDDDDKPFFAVLFN